MSFPDSDDDTVYDASSPLLTPDPEARPGIEPKKRTPLPILSLAALCFARLADPINFSQIFPYVNEYMIRLHITDDVDRIGYYSGLVESAFALCQLLVIFHWGKLSDRIGRRPVIIAGITGLALSTLGFGLSRSLASVIFFRCIGGMFSGNVATLNAVLGELTDSTNQHIAFPLYGIGWPLGNVLGPLLGGTLSNPASSYGGLFDAPFFREYPYFLPCFATTAFSFLTVLFAWVFLEETLPSKYVPPLQHRDNYGSIATMSRTPSDETICTVTQPEPSKHDDSLLALLSVPVMRSLCISGSALCLVGTAFDVVFVLFCFSPVERGGLGFTPSQIGSTLAASGFAAVVLQLFFMPYLLRRVCPGTAYVWCMRAFPFTFLLMPTLNILMRAETTNRPDILSPGLLIVLGITLLLSKVGGLAYSFSMLIVKIHSPSPQSLGSANGLVQVSWCITRSFAPAFVSSMYAISVDRQILGGHGWVLVMAAISLVGCWISTGVKTGLAPK